MLDWFINFLSSDGFSPHLYCLSGRTDLIIGQMISDIVIAVAYFSIPLAILYISTKRNDLKFKWVFVFFSAFIMACGTSHILEAVSLWYPFYAAETLIKALTALLSLITALALWPLVPTVLALPSRTALEQANQALLNEARQRREAEQKLIAVNASLETRIEERTHELNQARLAAERANAAKSEFLAMMSHELRTPLNIILGFAELMRDDSLDGNFSEKFAEYACDIHDSGSHLLEIINDILDISKLDAGKLEIDANPIDIERIIVNLSRIMALRVVKAGVILKSRIDIAARYFSADERAIKQIIINLVGNAIKYTGHDGIIDITVDPAPDDNIQLIVRDTGSGIPPDKLCRLGTPFEKVDNRYSQTTTGTGLGLALVKGLVSLHKGVMTIDSVVGKGTTVTIILPRTPPPKQIPPPHPD